MTLHIVREPDDARLAQVTSTEDGDVHAELALEAGQLRGLVLDTGSRRAAAGVSGRGGAEAA